MISIQWSLQISWSYKACRQCVWFIVCTCARMIIYYWLRIEILSSHVRVTTPEIKLFSQNEIIVLKLTRYIQIISISTKIHVFAIKESWIKRAFKIYTAHALTLERPVFYYLHGIGTALHKMRRIRKFVFLLLKVNEET